MREGRDTGSVVGESAEQCAEGEMDSHIDGGEREFGNRRNGHMSKQVQASMGEITINTSMDRDGTFEPQVVRKRKKRLADIGCNQLFADLSKEGIFVIR